MSLHYDELAQWLVEAGIPRERIWSSQGLMAPADDCMPLALTVTSPVKNYDSGGVSIEGSKPRDGQLGAISMATAASNEIAMENGGTLFATLAAIDPGICDRRVQHGRFAASRSGDRRTRPRTAHCATCGMRARASSRRWHGTARTACMQTARDYVSYTAWRNTPLEEAARDFLLARSGLPRGARLWTFGTHVARRRRWLAKRGRNGAVDAGRAADEARRPRPGRGDVARRPGARTRADRHDRPRVRTPTRRVASIRIAARAASAARMATARGAASRPRWKPSTRAGW